MRPLRLEPVRRTLLECAVDPDVGHRVEPPQRLRVQIGVRDEVAAVEEVPADVADLPLHLALRLSPAGAARPDAEAPVAGEAQELPVRDQPTPVRSLVIDDDRLHLVEEHLGGDAPEVAERGLQPPHHDFHGLTLVVLQPLIPRAAQHHHQRVPLPPRQPELRKVHLGLTARLGLEPPHRLR